MLDAHEKPRSDEETIDLGHEYGQAGDGHVHPTKDRVQRNGLSRSTEFVSE